MTADTLTFADQAESPGANGGKSMKFTFQPESKPLDGYTIKRAIHRGGFGEVYYALTDAGKEVALKLLKNHLDVELRGVSQCLNLKHPNLVTIFDVRRDGDGDHWVIMEYVAGKSLDQVLDAHPDGMPLDEVNAWLSGISEGLSFLHDRGIVHRDLKPGNIFLENGVVKIGDVGLSKFISESHRSAQTQSVGTVYYMAPEIAHGRYGREVDIYSLGIVLYELITGRVPFTGESAGEILMKHLSERPDLSPLPRRLRPVLAQALEKDPLRRTPTSRQLLHAYKQAAAGIDVPLEIPADSFLHGTVADSSTIERERAPQSPDAFPQPIPEDVAHWLGLDRTAQHELYRAQLDRWSAARTRKNGPNLKDVVAGDVAKAMELAEKAARRARQMAEYAQQKPWRHRRRQRPRRRFSWSAYARDACRARFPTFWGWGWRDINAPRRAPAPQPPPVPPVPPPQAKAMALRRGALVWWFIVPLVVLYLAMSRSAPVYGHSAVFPAIMVRYAICAVLVYGIYRCIVFLFRGPVPPNFAGAGASPNSPGIAPTAAGPEAGPGLAGKPAAAPYSVRRWTVLDPDTPRWIPFRSRMGDLSLSLTYATLCTAVIMAGIAAFGGMLENRAQIVQFGGTALVASWLILAQAKLMEGLHIDSTVRRIALALVGLAVGTASYWLNRSLLIDLPGVDTSMAAVKQIGSHSLVEFAPGGGRFAQPTWAGYVVFFGGLMALRNWWWLADSFRGKRLAIWPIISSAVMGLVLAAIFAFPVAWGIVWAVVISATVQVSAAWVPQPERAALMEAAEHASH